MTYSSDGIAMEGADGETSQVKDHSGRFFGSDAGYRWFTAIKYLTYAALCINAWLFSQEELHALEHTFTDGIEPSQIIQVFSATIDTVSWIILLLMFELETSVISDERITGWVKAVLHWLRVLCYVAIVYAFYGYCAELSAFFSLVPLQATDLCALAGQDLSMIVDIDEYVPLTLETCTGRGSELYQFAGLSIVGDAATMDAARWLAWTDVINSVTWILVVIMLEVEVRMQLRGNLSRRFMDVTRYFKFGLYGTLFACAAYWGYAGDLLDFWDASLWLFAFIFIELNVFEWQHETSQPANG